MSDKTIYSVHHFMFPFRWDYIDIEHKGKSIKDIPFEERTSLENAEILISKSPSWNRKNSLINEDYNHYTYYHTFVRNTLYDFRNNENKDLVRYFEYDVNKESDKYIIKYSEQKELTLDINGITLHLFQTGVGVLSFDLQNTLKEQSLPEHILKINEFGRRIYPQFLNFDDKQGKNCISQTQRAFLAESIEIPCIGKEDFNHYSKLRKDDELIRPFKPPAFIENLFPENLFVYHSENNIGHNYLRIKKITDDRMFFLSWYGNDYFSNHVAKNYKSNDWWYAYIFGDKTPKSIANQFMQGEQLDLHSYQRWSDYGTLYGMSRDSFVCISNKEATLEKNNAPNCRIHQSTIYYQIAILCLLQRATVLKFSAEVAGLASFAVKKDKRDKQLKEKIQTLYAHYIEFRNKIYFREVTPQIQGIEIYQKFQNILNLKNEVEDLDAEIEELNHFAAMLEQEEQTKFALEQANYANQQAASAKNLTVIATLLIPVTIVFSVFGSNFFERENFEPSNPDLLSILWLFGGLLLGLSIGFLILIKTEKIVNCIEKYKK